MTAAIVQLFPPFARAEAEARILTHRAREISAAIEASPVALPVLEGEFQALCRRRIELDRQFGAFHVEARG